MTVRNMSDTFWRGWFKRHMRLSGGVHVLLAGGSLEPWVPRKPNLDFDHRVDGRLTETVFPRKSYSEPKALLPADHGPTRHSNRLRAALDDALDRQDQVLAKLAVDDTLAKVEALVEESGAQTAGQGLKASTRLLRKPYEREVPSFARTSSLRWMRRRRRYRPSELR